MGMKKILLGVLTALCVLLTPIKSSANSLSYIPPESATGVPEEIHEYAEIIGNEFNICPELLMALAERESRFTADAENGSCKGLMQLNIGCHKQRFVNAGWSSSEWTDPYKNMYVAAAYLHDLFVEYEDVGIVLGLYHGESGAVSKGKAGRLSSYTNHILERSEELERIYGK